jgi:hypothetical protein
MVLSGAIIKSGSNSGSAVGEFDLIRYGYPIVRWDSVNPPVVIASARILPVETPSWAGGPCDLGAVQFRLVDGSGTAVVTSGSLTMGDVCSQTTFTATFSGYGPGVRGMEIEFRGKDRENWSGNYGSRLDRATLRLEMATPSIVAHSPAPTPRAEFVTIAEFLIDGPVSDVDAVASVLAEAAGVYMENVTVRVHLRALPSSTRTVPPHSILLLPLLFVSATSSPSPTHPPHPTPFISPHPIKSHPIPSNPPPPPLPRTRASAHSSPQPGHSSSLIT